MNTRANTRTNARATTCANARAITMKAPQQNLAKLAFSMLLLGVLICLMSMPFAHAASEEFSPRHLLKLDSKFKSADKDGDGALNQAEAESGGMEPVAKHFTRFDADRDGKVTRSEIRSALRARIN